MTSQQPSKVLKWAIDHFNWSAAAQDFADFWDQHVSNDKLILKEIFKGFNVMERVIDIVSGEEKDEYRRVNILFTRPSNGNLQIDTIVKIFYASPEFIDAWERFPAVPQSELVSIFEGFRRLTPEIGRVRDMKDVLLTEIIIEFIDRTDGLVNPSNPESCALCGGSRISTDAAPYQEVTHHRETCLLDRARAAIKGEMK